MAAEEHKNPHEDDELDNFEVSDMSPTEGGSMVSLLGERDASEERRVPSLTQPALPRDVVPASLFLLHLLISLIVGFSVGDIVTPTQKNLVSLNAAVLIFSTFYGIIWLTVFVAQMKRTFLWSSCALSLLGLVPLSIFFLVSYDFIGVVFGFIAAYFAIGDCIWMLRMRGRFDFVTVLLEMVTKILKENTILVYGTAGLLVIHSVWAIWCTSVIARIGDADMSWSWTLLVSTVVSF